MIYEKKYYYFIEKINGSKRTRIIYNETMLPAKTTFN